MLKDESLDICEVAKQLPLRVSRRRRVVPAADPSASGATEAVAAGPASIPPSRSASLATPAVAGRCAVFQAVADPLQLAQKLVDYSSDRQRVRFDKSFHNCSVCFEEKPGTQCFR